MIHWCIGEAALAGIREVILPDENEKDLEEIPDDVKAEMTFVVVNHMDEVLENALIQDVETGVAQTTGEGESSYDSPPVAH